MQDSEWLVIFALNLMLLTFVEAENFSEQVVAGTNYFFDAKFSLNCGGVGDSNDQIKSCSNFQI